MTDHSTVHHIVDEAIRTNSSIYIRYRDYNGNTSERMISPMGWAEPEKILAFCHLRNEERHFKTQNIIEISEEPLLPVIAEANHVAIQPDIQSIISKPITRPLRTSSSSQPAKLLFSNVTTANEWKYLLDYYRECLIHEYQQQFNIDQNSVRMVNLDEKSVHSFISGSNLLEFNTASQPDLYEFLDSSRRRNQQLCLGKSFVSLNSDKISPLLFVPVTIEQGGKNVVVLKPEEYNLNYAVLTSLGFEVEEIADFVEGYQNFINNQPAIQEVEKFIIQSLSERLSRPLPVFSKDNYSLSSVPANSIFDGAGLFWVNNEITGNLIAELMGLAKGNSWQNAPDIIKYLFDQMPVYDHAPALEFIEDQHFYVTNINTQQRKATRAVSDHPVTIVTGPPGTGKSQLVLNLIAQAYLDKKTVLLASHNNKAVDVVMDRLQGKIRFQGVVRTGSNSNRIRAVEQMKNALTQIHQMPIKDIETRYQDGKRVLKATGDKLDLIRDLIGKIQSYQMEKQEVLDKLFDGQRDQFASLCLPFIESDKLRLNEFLSNAIHEFRALIGQRQQLVAQLRETLNDREKNQPVVQMIREYETQWGLFDGGIIHKDEFLSLSDLVEYCLLWKQILSAISAKKGYDQAQKNFLEIKRKIDQKTEAMTEQQTAASSRLAKNRSAAEFIKMLQSLVELEGALDKVKGKKYSFVQKIAIALHLINPKEKFIERLESQLVALGLVSKPLEVRNYDAELLQRTFDALNAVVEMGGFLFELERCRPKLSDTRSSFEKAANGLSLEVLSEFDRLDLSTYDATSLMEIFGQIDRQAKTAEENLTKILTRCINFFLKNNEQIATLISFQQWIGKDKPWNAFGLNQDLKESQAFVWVRMWQKVIVIWEANAVIQQSQQQLAKLPKEETALSDYKTASDCLFTLADDLMQATWLNRAANVSNLTSEGTQNYCSAVKQLNELEYGRNPNLYQSLKEAERKNFALALQIFPIWAITNLTAKTNFPLTPELFDLVIIDEASQCDIPSAIPLIYRAKKVVIIGDPNQLRHIATLTPSLDKQIGQKFGVGLEAFSYRIHSLYDLGERTAGRHPGPILLNEHYRSDPRIITFSNEEFYGGQLIIKTDLTRLGFQKDYLNQHGGAYWLNVKGDFQRSPNGGAYNPEELKQIQVVVPQILQSLNRDGYDKATIGIVTPFRAQETRIHAWMNQTFPANSLVKSGTAHRFQGDECDVIIFSPVLSSGISDGTLNWLEETYNLLNVAITRARVCLIVVGDFDFCYQGLPARNRYNRLAKYIKERLNGICTSVTDLPIIGGERFEIRGILLDPANLQFNRTNLMRFIASCQDYIFWIDPYFDQGVIDLFDELFENKALPTIHKIHLMTAERQVKNFLGKPPQLRSESVVRLKEFLEEKGVDFDMRILRGEELPHDRFLYHPGGAINMPPFAGAYGKHRHVSEYTSSQTTIENFSKYWDKGIPIDDFQHSIS